jgi:hypothetical protein
MAIIIINHIVRNPSKPSPPGGGKIDNVLLMARRYISQNIDGMKPANNDGNHDRSVLIFIDAPRQA